jgi:hypothetical protein
MPVLLLRRVLLIALFVEITHVNGRVISGKDREELRYVQ